MPRKLRIIKSGINNPYFNLAAEESFFKEVRPGTQTLYLWQNGPTVVIGKHQNPWAECDVSTLQRDNVFLSRRKSGGGAVYQDLGNSIFTFLSPTKDYSKDRNNTILLDSLKLMGVKSECEVSGRNDILCDGSKISGAAYEIGDVNTIHHGTMLLNTDLERLGQYLSPNKKKLDSKGVASVKSRVTNLVEHTTKHIDHSVFCDCLAETFCKAYDVSPSRVSVEVIGLPFLETHPDVKRSYEHLSSWEWCFGKTPKFSAFFEEKFDWGMVSIHVNVVSGRVVDAKVFSDSLFPKMVDEIEKRVKLAGTLKEIPRSLEISEFASLEDPVICKKFILELSEWFGMQN